MPFTEMLKLEVRKKAAFRCCRCQSIGVQIHHILPQADKGPDTIKNAAPLCPSCHDYYGANPVKRKEISEMRDWWYKVAEIKYGTSPVNESALEKITQELQALREDSGHSTQALDDLKDTLQVLTQDKINNIQADTAADAVNEVIEFSAPKMAKISDLKQGPIRHEVLPRDLVNRIEIIYWTFSGYLSVTKAETLENFRRDMHPEREVKIWEEMTKVLLEIEKKHKWDNNRMKGALGLLLMLSTQPADTIAKENIKLTANEAKVVFNLWGS